MSNWSKSDKHLDHALIEKFFDGFGPFQCDKDQQAAGTNDKKWEFFVSVPCFTLTKTRVTHRINSIIHAANTKPMYTPEQQEMIDFFRDYQFGTIGIHYMEKVYIEIINKHRSK